MKAVPGTAGKPEDCHVAKLAFAHAKSQLVRLAMTMLWLPALTGSIYPRIKSFSPPLFKEEGFTRHLKATPTFLKKSGPKNFKFGLALSVRRTAQRLKLLLPLFSKSGGFEGF